MSTKEKIINESLNLFNSRTFNMSTTSSIAQKTNILEGSLWYHFNSKNDLVAKHLSLFSDLYFKRMSNTKKNSHIKVIQGLFSVYEVIWDYRYLFRDSFDQLSKTNKALLAKISEINQSVDNWVKETVQHSRDIGILQIKDNDVDSIVEISLIIGRYWLDFSMKKYPKKSNLFLRKKGINLIIKSLHPFLSKDSKQIMDTIYVQIRNVLALLPYL